MNKGISREGIILNKTSRKPLFVLIIRQKMEEKIIENIWIVKFREPENKFVLDLVLNHEKITFVKKLFDSFKTFWNFEIKKTVAKTVLSSLRVFMISLIGISSGTLWWNLFFSSSHWNFFISENKAVKLRVGQRNLLIFIYFKPSKFDKLFFDCD